jgi:glycosyltransferase involved in cell wall biosynthesis
VKLVFAHDHIFHVYNGECYSNGGLSFQALSRYLNTFGELKVLSRQNRINNHFGNLTRASGEGIEFVNIPNFKSALRYSNIFKAKRIIEEKVIDSDFLISRLPSSIGSLAVKFAIKHDVPYAVEVVGCAWDALWNYGNLQAKLLAPFSYLNMRQLVKNSNYAVYVTSEFLQRKYPCSGMTIGCANVELPMPQDDVLSRRLDKIDQKTMNGDITLGLIGSLGSKFKGFDIAIKAVRQLSREFENIELQILGSGQTDPWIRVARKEKVEDKVHFLGTVENGNDVFRWLDNIDIYIQPSRTEGLPRATIEAMSRGCPVVGAKAGGIPELIDNAFVHKIGDSQDLAGKIRVLIRDKELSKNQATTNFRNSRQYARDALDSRRNNFWKTVMMNAISATSD